MATPLVAMASNKPIVTCLDSHFLKIKLAITTNISCVPIYRHPQIKSAYGGHAASQCKLHICNQIIFHQG
jgi:hypothetical protein